MLRSPAADIAARFPGAGSCERQTKRLRVVGLIGRTRGSTASLHERQRSRSRTWMHGLARLTHNVDYSTQRIAACKMHHKFVKRV